LLSFIAKVTFGLILTECFYLIVYWRWWMPRRRRRWWWRRQTDRWRITNDVGAWEQRGKIFSRCLQGGL